MVRGVGFQQVELCVVVLWFGGWAFSGWSSVLLCYGEGGGLSAGGALCCCVMVRGVGF